MLKFRPSFGGAAAQSKRRQFLNRSRRNNESSQARTGWLQRIEAGPAEEEEIDCVCVCYVV